MKTALFSLSYLDGEDASGSSRLERNARWLKYYWPLKDELGFQNIILADNASRRQSVINLMDRVPMSWEFRSMPAFRREPMELSIFQFGEHLARGSSGFPPVTPADDRANFDYPYCWRGFWFLRDLFVLYKFEKIILIDTDMFVLTKRVAKYIKEARGWTALWSEKYQFPETSLSVIEGDGVQKFLEFTNRPWQEFLGRKMETTLPYTHVEKGFIGDRYGEYTYRETVPVNPDYYGQCPINVLFPGDLI